MAPLMRPISSAAASCAACLSGRLPAAAAAAAATAAATATATATTSMHQQQRQLHTSGVRTAATKISPSEMASLLEQRIGGWTAQQSSAGEMGKVFSVGDGIARLLGLGNVQAGELVEFQSGALGMALNLERDNVGAVIFGDDRAICEGQSVKRTKRIVDVPIGPQLLGRVVDALGEPIDGKVFL
ncbi:ATP synthase alpha chain, putative [Eimeria acervulina]|uniref:ATP synthase alpha chain, putative n=1 Tax=Eimeria acervulina TaxID=5801 RepID=U6H0P3_EIMAC|nr:ATP synthase alpha chain, putative [Eimeria acervulina]CDI84339.1 ATP synthase alpha chain, putative [Eimeria acervulina]